VSGAKCAGDFALGRLSPVHVARAEPPIPARVPDAAINHDLEQTVGEAITVNLRDGSDQRDFAVSS
jgi:hypothetical protein